MSRADLTQAVRDSFAAALRATQPGELVGRHLPDESPALILAVGKAALTMVAPALLHAPSAPWLVSPPNGAPTDQWSAPLADPATGQVLPGSHPLPDAGSVAAAEAALAAVRRVGQEDLVLVLVSGGGSALWSAPLGVDLPVKRDVTARLLLAGADVTRLNAVRKHLSAIKGGRLAVATRARLMTLALSDVPGDDPGTIASGPTVPDASTYDDALTVLSELGVVADTVEAHLRAGARGSLPETPKPGDGIEERSVFTVVGSNRTLLAAAAAHWRGIGHPVIVLSDALQGEARDLALAHADLATALVRGRDPTRELGRLARPGEAAELSLLVSAATRVQGGLPLVVLSGGEATVTVKGSGRGGRNQEFALWLHHFLVRDGIDTHVTGLAAGSDGVDGNSEAAGAVVTPTTAARAATLGLSAAAHLARNDSHSFFERLGDAVVTGPTGTNLNDYRVMVVVPAA